MKIALDYDGTYTLDPVAWNEVIDVMLASGHDIRVVTHRHHELDCVDDQFMIPVIYTDGIAKKWFCEHRGDFWSPDVWIDDRPIGILENGPLSMKLVEEWRKSR